MLASLHAHYLEIEWHEFKRARTITVAPEPIEISELDSGVLTAETQVFHDFCPWVGLRLEGELAAFEPAFEGSDGVLSSMLRLKDGHGDHWWVQDSGWDPAGKRHLSELHRSMGQFTVVLGPYRLLLNNVVDGLRRVEVEAYLHDFQHDLIWLVLGFGGATAAATSGVKLNQELIEALEAFTAAAHQVLARPACAVREVQVDNLLARLRPNSTTFRQYLRQPAAQRLPGRGAEETPDIADNRYLRHLVQVCEKLSSSLARAVVQQANRFLDRARLEGERSAIYKSQTHREVDPDIFNRQLEELKRKLAGVEKCCDAYRDPNEMPLVLEFRAGDRFADLSDTIFFSNKDGSTTGSRHGNEYEFSILKMPEALAEAIQLTRSFCDYYRLEGAGSVSWRYSKKGKPYREVHFTQIYSAKPFTKAIQRKLEKGAQLEKNGWLAPLTRKERQESQQEARTAQLREQTYQRYAQQAEQASFALSRCQRELQVQNRAWEKLGVAAVTTLPMGVRFSQSPTYTACKVAFFRLMQLAQQGGLELSTLDTLDRIGLLHASALYERWCLVKILIVLMQDYHFQPEAGWQEQLVRVIAGKPESVELKLHRADVGLFAYLEIQPVLPNGRRPDFRLRFSYDLVTPASDDADDDWNGETQGYRAQHNKVKTRALVLDAKFRTSWRRGELGRTLTSLIAEKNYSQHGDRVFILHPAPKAILTPTSPLIWGKDCDYGQEAGRNHMKGVVYLAPGAGATNPELNLRRLIVMQLQATFPVPVKIESLDGPCSESKSFCIRCGKAHQSQDLRQQSTQRGSSFWILSCSECQMQTTRTHCYGCESGLIYKNGLNFTYHRTVADQVTNIACPQCGRYFDNDVHGRENASVLQESDVYEYWPV